MVAYTILVVVLILVVTLLVETARRKKPDLYHLLREWQTGLAALVALVGLSAGAFYADQAAQGKERRDALTHLTVMRWEIYGVTFRAEEVVGYWGPRIEGLKKSDLGKDGEKLTKENSISAYAIGEWSRLPERSVFPSLSTQMGAVPGEFVRDIMNYHLTVDLYERIAGLALKRAVDGRTDAGDAKGILFSMNVICSSGQQLGQKLDAYLANQGAPVAIPLSKITCKSSSSDSKPTDSEQ